MSEKSLSTKMSEKSLGTKMSENDYQNLRKILLCLHTKKLQKFQNFQNLIYSSESAWRSSELNYWTIEFNSDGNFKNRIEFVKIQKFILVSFLWFSLKNDILGLKMKILKFLGIQPILGIFELLEHKLTPIFGKGTYWVSWFLTSNLWKGWSLNGS